MPRQSRTPNTIDIMETLLKAQLKALEELRQSTDLPTTPTRRKSPSQMDMASDILSEAGQPLHAHDIIDRIDAKYGVHLSRESLVSALLKHTARGRFRKTGRNTFALPLPESRP